MSSYFVGIAGNQTERAGRFIRELNLPADAIATSDDWGAEKPSPEFFTAMTHASGTTPDQTAYVGDRMDNDIHPAAAAGLHTIWIRRGPWGYITHTPGWADHELASLADLPERLKR